MRVLISEALEPVRSRLAGLVQEQPGFELLRSESTLAATVEAVRREPPDLLLIGSRLADGSGFDALRQLRSEVRHISVILLCDQLDGEYLYSGRALGADFVLESPRDIGLVPSLMRKLRQRQRQAAAEGETP